MADSGKSRSDSEDDTSEDDEIKKSTSVDDSVDTKAVDNSDNSSDNDESADTKEADTDAQPNKAEHQAGKTSKHRFGWLKQKKIWIPALIVVILALVGGIPYTRYKVAGLFIKQNYHISLVDIQSHQPVSAATISLDGKTALTNNYGNATLKVPVGNGTLVITKKYYKTKTVAVLVPLHSHGAKTYTLKATGRQVPIVVTNRIGGGAVANALISASGSQARTNNQGVATIVLPADQTTVSATISASGYNTETATVQITTQSVPANSFVMIPQGQIFFLSNSSGTVNVMKANLDGSDPQTAVAGTGNEDVNATSIYPSADWKYVALFAQRSSTNPGVYLINTSNDQLTNIDEGNAVFNFNGWTSTDSLVYTVTRNAPTAGQATQVLKSYNATAGQLTTLDQSIAGTSDYGSTNSQFVNVNILSNNTIVYLETLNGSSDPSANDTINSISANGTNKQTILSLPADAYYGYGQSSMLSPTSIIYELQTADGNYTSEYYEYSSGKVTQVPASDLTDINTLQNPLTFYLSPAGDKTVWSTLVNGHTAINVGDGSGNNQQQVALLDNTYQLYGWYGDGYLLVVKNQNELYIMPASGVTNQSQLIKITDLL